MNNEELRNLQRKLLDEALFKGIQKNEEQQKIWTAYKKGHAKVTEALQIFQKDVHVNCMVPIGKRALMKGKLIHTNEVLVCLGDGYFAKYSATGAAALCERRIQRADEMLENLAKERDLYDTRLMMVKDKVFDDCAGGEIIEHWNEDQIDDWRKKHREREKEYHQELAKLKQEKKTIETEEDLFQRLDQLEIEEEIADELNRLEDERYELFGEELEEDESESESSSECEEEVSAKEKHSDTVKDSKEEIQPCKIRKSVSFADMKTDLNRAEDPIKTENSSAEGEEEEDSEDVLRIEFSHTISDLMETKSESDSVETPADIYRIFSKPKSILKRSPNDNPQPFVAPVCSMEEEEEDEEEEEEAIKPSVYETIVKDIVERNATLSLNPAKTEIETRPISKFRRDRQSKY